MGEFADVPLVVDTTALSKWRRFPPDVKRRFVRALRNGELRISPIVKLEFLHDAYDREQFEKRDQRLECA